MQIPFWAILTTIAYNILANLLTPPIQKLLESISESLKKRNAEKKRIFENTVQYLLNNPQEQVYLRVRYAERNITSFIVLFAGYFLTMTNNGLLVVFGIILFILGNYGFTSARNMGKLANEIWRRKKANHPNINLD